ncbi:hypothetical protein P154DRAFT_529122 [Amniculicola lignicola CBS 123094]|uniref:Uncharacterized protein n=1 Tax=Amniculicola lignicola CBS 123094 TaxID=1392246 RepID=A0A6A5X3L8_9PLEO|nr:hypothetical protein P154DRAFT_529122 [Amniculicola lignicola CBS 123094]
MGRSIIETPKYVSYPPAPRPPRPYQSYPNPGPVRPGPGLEPMKAVTPKPFPRPSPYPEPYPGTEYAEDPQFPTPTRPTDLPERDPEYWPKPDPPPVVQSSVP